LLSNVERGEIMRYWFARIAVSGAAVTVAAFLGGSFWGSYGSFWGS
jgi:hypothetical protein